MIEDELTDEGSDMLRPSMNSAQILHSNNDLITKFEDEPAEDSDDAMQTPMHTVKTVEFTPTITTTTHVTVINRNPETQESASSSNLPILAWRRNSVLEEGSGSVSQEKPKVIRPNTHAEVVSRRRKINCAMS